ncbi:MAG: hypothetical protein ABR875_01295 [Minisyncoccia bacterium]
MVIKKISVFGNPDLKSDSLPLGILPRLQKKFPEIEFLVEDPNELNLPASDTWIIVDTVAGIKQVQLLAPENIKSFAKSRVSMHDFDLKTHLFWIKKIKKNLKIKIIGIPPMISEKLALKEASNIIATLFPENGRRN